MLSYLSRGFNGTGSGRSSVREGIRWFTDGERRYSNELWKLASIRLLGCAASEVYPYENSAGV